LQLLILLVGTKMEKYLFSVTDSKF